MFKQVVKRSCSNKFSIKNKIPLAPLFFGANDSSPKPKKENKNE